MRLDHLLSRELFCQLSAFGRQLADRVFSQVDPTQVVHSSGCLYSWSRSKPQTFSAPLSSRSGAHTVGHHSGPSAQAGPLCCVSVAVDVGAGVGRGGASADQVGDVDVGAEVGLARAGRAGRGFELGAQRLARVAGLATA